MRKIKRELVIALLFLCASALGYTIHYLLFRDAHHIFIYMIGDISFVFIEVFLVTIILHRILDKREKVKRLGQLNIVIGSFFSEVGRCMIKSMSKYDPRLPSLSEKMHNEGLWKPGQFRQMAEVLHHHPCTIDPHLVEWECMKEELVAKREFMLRLLENPNLLEHEKFSDLLQAIFHLLEELEARGSFENIPDSDLGHLNGDMERVYSRLIAQWVRYMQHLRTGFPYLFSLAIRQNPLNDSASVIITE